MRLRTATLTTLALIIGLVSTPVCHAVETWERLDKRLKLSVYQVNVGIRMRLRNGMHVQLTDLSPKYRFPVFGTSTEDKGFRVVGFGTTFPIKTARSDRMYLLTNRHVVDSGDGVIKEFERFYAAMRLHADNTAGFGHPENRYRELQNLVNLSQKKQLNLAERAIYTATVDGIWDTYENNLSVKADPTREKFKKYLALSGAEGEIGYFVHVPGPVSQPSIPAQVYKIGRPEGDPDLAILTINAPPQAARTPSPALEFDPVPPTEGQEIQVIGYPLASDQIDADSNKYYSPTFSTGRISRVAPNLLQVDAPVTKGNSGGPVVSLRGKVLGVVVRRAITAQNLGGAVVEQELTNFAGAITSGSVKSFAPELFAAGR